ncbi:hypothetical protein ACFSJ3_02095 [Corallincola platygyrae]|uniref:Polymerase nucleotidyl transferase domain-containing protein n=1 Tax=Corallincola platygyrae TaxID=1193278 RepID=A0ABW4XIB0_9GAMM
MAIDVAKEIRSSLRSLSKDKSLCLLLAGSFARDEYTFLESLDGNVRSLSDIEFVIFQNNKDFLAKKNHKEIERRMNTISKDLDIVVDFSIKPNFSIRSIPNTFFWYEAITQSKCLIGNVDTISEKKFEVENKGDIYETICHSVISVIKEFHKLGSCSRTKIDTNYRIIKCALDLFIPLTYLRFGKVATHSKRFEVLKNAMVVENDDLHGFSYLFDAIYSVKISKRYVNESELSSIDLDRLTSLYIEFSLYVYNKINDEIKKNGTYIGDSSFLRKIFLVRSALKNYQSSTSVLSRQTPSELYKANINYLENLRCNISGQKYEKKFSKVKFDIKDESSFYSLNRMIYRYL